MIKSFVLIAVLALCSVTQAAMFDVFENDQFSFDTEAGTAPGAPAPIMVSGNTISPTLGKFTALQLAVSQDSPGDLTAMTDEFTLMFHNVTFLQLGIVGEFGPVTLAGGPGFSFNTDPPFGSNKQVIPEPSAALLFCAAIPLALLCRRSTR